MLLAGNAPTATPKAAPVQAAIAMPRSSVPDRLTISHQAQPFATTPRRSSPAPMTPISIPQCGGRSGGIRIETSSAKPSSVRMSPPIHAEPLKTVAPLGSATFLSSESVPQFRRKSLARFLEKRKERVISASPYNECQSSDYNGAGAGAGSTSLSMNSSGSCPVPAAN